MSLSVSNVNAAAPVANVNSVSKTNRVSFKGADEVDTFEQQPKESRLSVEEKQEIMHAARKNAAGWSILGCGASTLYYAIRSNKTIADKYNLDPKADKAFINKIRQDQVIWTLPGAFGVGIIGYIAAACQNSEDIDVD